MIRLVAFARRHRRRFVWGAFLLLCTNASALLIPQLFRIAIDEMQGGADFAVLRSVALLMLLAAAAGAVFRVRSRVHIFYAARDIEYELRTDFYRHLARQPPAFFETHPTGDLMSRATNDLTQVRLLFGPGMLNLVNTGIAFASTIPLMFLISAKLTLISLCVYIPGLLIVAKLSRSFYLKSRDQQQQLGELQNLVQEHLAGTHVVRAFAIEDRQGERFEKLNRDYYLASVRLAWVRSYLWRLISGFASFGILLAVFLGARDVMAGHISLGELVALVEYLALLAWPSFALGWIISLYQRGMSGLNRLDEVLDQPPSIASGTVKPDTVEPSIEIRDLTVRRGENLALDRVSVRVPAGGTLGVVGPIGSGKSSLVHALVRELDVAPGQISIGGYDITELHLSSLRRLFGLVQQNPVLFSKTVEQNVAFGAPDRSRSEIEAALARAAFNPDIKALPQAIETPVGERGITLSGGQKQRLAIARALLLDPPILVLDDALSSVDAETEAEILDRLKQLRSGKTDIIVAHRITAVQHAQEISVLDRGQVVERGDHNSLMACGGLYATMARRQELQRGLAEVVVEKIA